jgi:hypothetical protein
MVPQAIFFLVMWIQPLTLTRKDQFLIGNSTSNLAEYFMHIVAKPFDEATC